MKRIILSIDQKYTDGRKNDHFAGTSEMVFDMAALINRDLSSYIGIKHINFQTGEVETDGHGVMHAGVPLVIEKSFLVTTVSYVMEDDGVPCNEENLVIRVECNNSKNGQKQKIDLPYRKGASVTLTPHPYKITVLDVRDQEVDLEVDDGRKVSHHLVQLYRPDRRNDEEPFATGSPNDPVDYAGPIVYFTLLPK